ncbi:FixH family protein [Caldibacillus lycopersici]|uniref:FixH family protein n=1 Tax=Perspicuibacillus lycopersici TaxID=1325689 RepID=A0AAE3IU76_9BACI|nr:FixH family protein [Perspicuibacillus lycopersici]MCU9614693.1 FixH family protein [Perspicuibacillus lycopersici]
MKKILLFSLLSSIFIFLTACNQEKQNSGEVPEMVDVQLEVPKQAEAGEAVTLAAHVTQGNENVDDADEVIFEIWAKDKKEDSTMVEVTQHEKGIYQADYTFDESGIYYVQSHVTARRMHVMPKTEIVIGESSKE